MSTEFWIQMIVYAISIGSFAGVVLTRLAYLEKKMDAHNALMERVAALEAVNRARQASPALEQRPQPGA